MRPPEHGAARQRERSLVSNRSGAVLVIGLFAAVLLAGALFLLMGTIDAINHREIMQDAADGSAFSAATTHARAMNMMAMLNIAKFSSLALYTAMVALFATVSVVANATPSGTLNVALISAAASIAANMGPRVQGLGDEIETVVHSAELSQQALARIPESNEIALQQFYRDPQVFGEHPRDTDDGEPTMALPVQMDSLDELEEFCRTGPDAEANAVIDPSAEDDAQTESRNFMPLARSLFENFPQSRDHGSGGLDPAAASYFSQGLLRAAAPLAPTLKPIRRPSGRGPFQVRGASVFGSSRDAARPLTGVESSSNLDASPSQAEEVPSLYASCAGTMAEVQEPTGGELADLPSAFALLRDNPFRSLKALNPNRRGYDSESLSLRYYAYRSDVPIRMERGVRIATWGQDEPAEKLDDLRRAAAKIAFSQASYFPSKISRLPEDALWNMDWKASLSRFRLPADFDARALVQGCDDARIDACAELAGSITSLSKASRH